jgi:cytochrome c oxidase subunit 1
MGMTRRVYTYPDLPGWGILNFISTAGGFLMGLAVLLLIYTLVKAIRNGRLAESDPWDANTLEWTTTSPPPLKNFQYVIPVKSARPYRDYKRPDDTDFDRKDGYGQ